MTAREVLTAALDLMGMTDSNGNEQLTQRIKNKAIALINTVYADLWGIVTKDEFVPIKTLSDEIKLEGRARAVLPYGVAAFIAGSEEDGLQQQIWMSMYNKKRAGLTQVTRVKDVIPKPEY